MTRDDIIRMAREAGGLIYEVDWYFEYENLERFANLIAAAEREACAALCDTEANREELDGDETLGARYGAHCCAIAIRERGAP